MIQESRLFKNLNVYEKLSSIILDNKISFSSGSNLVFLKGDSYHYAKDFLHSESVIYDVIFSKLYKNRLIKFNRNYTSCFNIKKQRLEIKYTKTLDDLFSLIHEFFHYVYYNEKDSDISMLFKEVFSIFNELRLGEYLNKNCNQNEVGKQIWNIYYENYKMCINSKLELKFYNEIKQERIIDFNKISNELYDYYFKHRIFYDKVSIDRFGTYIFGILLATYINQGLKSGEISELDYEYCKYEFSNLSLKDICSVLNLDLSFKDGLDISDSSIKKLEKSYKLEAGKYIEK